MPLALSVRNPSRSEVRVEPRDSTPLLFAEPNGAGTDGRVECAQHFDLLQET